MSDFLLSGRKQVVSDREESTAEARPKEMAGKLQSSERNLSGATCLGRRSFARRNSEDLLSALVFGGRENNLR